MKKDNELLLSFIKMNDLLPAFELFRQSQGEKDVVKTSSSGALSPKEDVVAKDDKSSNGGDGDDEPSDETVPPTARAKSRTCPSWRW